MLLPTLEPPVSLDAWLVATLRARWGGRALIAVRAVLPEATDCVSETTSPDVRLVIACRASSVMSPWPSRPMASRPEMEACRLRVSGKSQREETPKEVRTQQVGSIPVAYNSLRPFCRPCRTRLRRYFPQWKHGPYRVAPG